jgi:transcription elongation GreA/GreB family factor
MERDQFNEKRSNRLRDFILEDQALIAELTATADIEVVKDLTRALKLSPVFDDMDKRSLLARLVKAHPAVQSLVSGEQTKQEAGPARLVGQPRTPPRRISGAGREEDSRELQGNRHRPQLRRLAREPRIQGRQGDAENSHAPEGGSRSRSSIARAVRILPTPKPMSSDPAPSCSATDLATNQPETFTILGAWDSDPDKGVISYLTPVAMALLNRKVGDEVEFELHGSEASPPHGEIEARRGKRKHPLRRWFEIG